MMLGIAINSWLTKKTTNRNATAKQMVPNFAHIGQTRKILISSYIKTLLLLEQIAQKLMSIHVLIHRSLKLCRVHQSAISHGLASKDIIAACRTLFSQNFMELNFAKR